MTRPLPLPAIVRGPLLSALLLSGSLVFSGCSPSPSTSDSITPGEIPLGHLPEEAFFDPSRWRPEEGFQVLTRLDFDPHFTEAETWSDIQDGFYCSGKPKGYLATKRPYRNFTLRLDYRFRRPDHLKNDAAYAGNTGFLFYITGEQKVWPLSLEVQGKHTEMGDIRPNGGAEKPVVTLDTQLRDELRSEVGRWNSLEIVSQDGALSVMLNGETISHCEPAFLSEGLIGVQSEGFPFEIRRMRIQEETPATSPAAMP